MSRIALGWTTFTALFLALPGTSTAASCNEALAARTMTELQLPYREFDQSEHSGWRPLAAEKCYLEAATLIERYIALQSTPDRMLYWHQAQSLAFGGKPSVAAKIAATHGLRDPDDVLKHGYRWNEFARATIAYWRGDRRAFRKQKSLLEAAIRDQPDVPAVNANKGLLEALGQLDRCFSKPYVEAVACPS